MSSDPNTTSPPPPAVDRLANGNGAADAALTQRIAAASQKLYVLSSDISRLVDQIDRWNGRSGLAAPAEAPHTSGDALAAMEQVSAQVSALAGGVRQLEARMRGLEDLSLASPRKPMRLRLVELLIGREYFRGWWQEGPVPAVTAVVPIGDDRATAATVRSILRPENVGWDAIVAGPEPGPQLRLAMDAAAGRARHVLVAGPMWDWLDKALGDASKSGVSTVIGIIHPGQLLEPTAAAAVMRFFRDHPRTQVGFFERTVRRGAWRQPMPRPRRMDVYALLAEPGTNGWGHGGVFFRRAAMGMAGGYKPAMRSAAEWHLYLRLVRMWGIRRGTGQVLSITADEAAAERCGEYLEFEQARQEFLGNFGIPGRARCRAIYLLKTVANATDPPDHPPPLPASTTVGEAEIIEDAPECPLSGQKPDRLLLTAPDESGNPCRIYRCPGGIGAMVRPLENGGAAGGAGDAAELFRRYHRDSTFSRWLTDQTPPGSAIGGGNEEELVAALLDRITGDDSATRLLLVADSPGGESLAQRTRWNITRLTGKLDDAALALPEELRFDVIWAGSAIRQSPDPAGTLRSLRSVLSPGGIVAFMAPNLDSRLRRRFGPNWAGWNVPHYPLILGCRGMREVARLSDLRVLKLRSRTDLPGVLRNLKRNSAGSPPPGVAERLTRWARLLWDWRGRGEEWLVMLKGE